jgi:hypothetical protein
LTVGHPLWVILVDLGNQSGSTRARHAPVVNTGGDNRHFRDYPLTDMLGTIRFLNGDEELLPLWR